jgi:PAS domain S-box-containing protein
LQFVSPSIKRLLGYDPESLVGTYPISLTHPEDEETMRAVNFRDPECPFVNKPIQFRLRNAGGEYIWFETIFTLIDEPGEKDGFILSQSRDISWRKQYQTALEERGRELERSNADLETFAFVSSHDIQEPLRMISNYTQLLKKRYKGQLDKDADEYIEYANRGAVHLQQLLRDLLSYSRITRSEIKAVPMDLNNLMVGLIKNIGLEIDEKKAKVVYGTLPYITSDPNLVMLVIQNLILNGIKYNRSENPEVVITTVTKPREIVFCFADNGIGIDIAHQQRVFEPFQRLHTKAEYPGTGLGLSICKKIVERLGGKMWLESEPGKGSKFYFTIPLN